jgi:hypothetical protein
VREGNCSISETVFVTTKALTTSTTGNGPESSLVSGIRVSVLEEEVLVSTVEGDGKRQ